MNALVLAALIASSTAVAASDEAGDEAALPVLVEPEVVREGSFKPHRHAYLIGGVFLAGGVAFGLTSRAEWMAGVNDPHARTAAYSWQSSRDASYLAVAALSIGATAIIYALARELIGSEAPSSLELTF